VVYLHFNIQFPFRKTWYPLWSKDGGRLFSHKYIEYELMKDNYLIKFELDFSFQGKDHAGLDFCLGLFGYVFRVNIYDNRHWDYEKNEWINKLE
jgi:hypothetical protein